MEASHQYPYNPPGSSPVPWFLTKVGFRASIGVAVVVAVRFAWLLNCAEDWDTPNLPLLSFLCELPLALVIFAFIRGTSSERLARSCGIALGVSAVFAATIPPMFFVTIMRTGEFPGKYRGLEAFQSFLPICLISALWLGVCAFRLRQNNRLVSLRWTAVGVASAVLVLVLIRATSVPGSGEAKSNRAHQRSSRFWNTPSVRASEAG